MSKYTVIVSSAAREEVAEACAYIADESSPTAALHWLEGLEAVIASLGEMPERLPVAREDPYFPHGTLRRALHFRHRVLFTVEQSAVYVLHVRHGMRDELTSP